MEEKMLTSSGSAAEQVELTKDYTNDAIKQFAAAVDASYANLYTRAGHYLDNKGEAIVLTPENAKDIFCSRGNIKFENVSFSYTDGIEVLKKATQTGLTALWFA